MVTSRIIGQVGGLPGHPDLVQRCPVSVIWSPEHLAGPVHEARRTCATSSASALMTRADVAFQRHGVGCWPKASTYPNDRACPQTYPTRPGKTVWTVALPTRWRNRCGKFNAHRLADINEDLVQARVVQTDAWLLISGLL